MPETVKEFDNETMKIDIAGSAFQLAQMIKTDKSLIERDLFTRGADLLGLFEDLNFKDTFQNFRELKVALFKMAIEDLAMGGVTLKSSTLGLTFRDGKIKTFISPFGANPQGTVMFSINLKSAVQKGKKTEGEDSEMPQEDLNAAIYRLTVALSELVEAA